MATAVGRAISPLMLGAAVRDVSATATVNISADQGIRNGCRRLGPAKSRPGSQSPDWLLEKNVKYTLLRVTLAEGDLLRSAPGIFIERSSWLIGLDHPAKPAFVLGQDSGCRPEVLETGKTGVAQRTFSVSGFPG